jgi:hypothetical protein
MAFFQLDRGYTADTADANHGDPEKRDPAVMQEQTAALRCGVPIVCLSCSDRARDT